jgi:hypothetical protein
MRRLALLLLLAGLICGPLPLPAAELSGSLKTFDLYRRASPVAGFDSGAFSSNRLRLELEQPLAGRHTFNAALDSRWLLTDPAGLPPLPADNLNRRVDLEKSWNRDDNSAQQLQIDRLQLHLVGTDLEWDLGRQPIGFGRIVLFSPLDVIAPFPPDALDTDVRPGVDALRVTRYFGAGGQLGGTLVFGQTDEDNSYLLTFSHNWNQIDILAIGGSLRDNWMGGLGLAGSLAGVGLKGELSFYEGKDVGLPGGDRSDQFMTGAIEGWFRLDNGLVLLGQYLYNGPGSHDPADYLSVAQSAPITEGLTFLTGRHYLLLAPSYEIHPLATLQGLVIWNLLDDSFLARPLFELSLADNLSLQLFWTINVGEKPLATLPLPVPRSEFGSVGNSGGMFLSWYF